jgi:Transposase DDE domain
LNHDHIYVIDSLPVVACDHIRIKHATLYTDEQFRGYIASKKRYFYGLKIHLMVTKDGQPVEFFLTHGGFGDVDALKHYVFDLPEGAIIYADKAYNPTLSNPTREKFDIVDRPPPQTSAGF